MALHVELGDRATSQWEVGKHAAFVVAHSQLVASEEERDDPNHVGIDLEFDSEEEADSFYERLTGLWQRVVAEG